MKSIFLFGVISANMAIALAPGQVTEPALGQATPPLDLVQTIPLRHVTGGFNHHSADGKLRRLFLCATANRTVEVVDLNTGTIIKSLPGERPSATCFAPNLNLLCVSRGSTLELYDAKSFDRLVALAMPSGVDELQYDSRAKLLYAGCMNAPNEGITPVDLIQRKVLEEIKLPASPQGFCLEDDGNRLFASTPRANQVTVIDRKISSIADAWKVTDVQGNYPVAYDAATHRLFVGCRKPAKLLVLDTRSGKAVGSGVIGTDTDDLAFDPVTKRVYVACGEGVISVIQQDDADRYRNIASVTTASGARNCVFIPESGEFCVTVPPRDDQPAKILVYKAQRNAN
jgi:DNA-binding beta-propeller fold protein YncE